MIRIDLWSDVVCPWCYIGKRRLEAGIEAFAATPEAQPVEVEFRSFQLDPDMPTDFEGTAAQYLALHKGVPEPQAAAMQTQVTRIAAEVGLEYDFASLRPANTTAAHQVLHLAKRAGLQGVLKERLLRAHFGEGRHVGQPDELADLAAEVGLDRGRVIEALSTEEFLADVRADQQLAAQLGIRGVPFFVIAGRYGISGAQPAELFTRALTEAASA